MRSMIIVTRVLVTALLLSGCGKMDLKVASKMKSPTDPTSRGKPTVQNPPSTPPVPTASQPGDATPVQNSDSAGTTSGDSGAVIATPVGNPTENPTQTVPPPAQPGATNTNPSANPTTTQNPKPNPNPTTSPSTATTPANPPSRPNQNPNSGSTTPPRPSTGTGTGTGTGSSTRPQPSSGSTQQSSYSEMAKGIKSFWDVKGATGKQWTAITLESIEAYRSAFLDRVPSDIETYCPSYHLLGRDERLAFWVNFIAQMVDHESSFNTFSSHAESFKDRSGTNVVSRGLLQLSNESVRALGCHILSAQDLYDPKTNLTCGIKILARYVGEDGRIFGYSQRRWYGAPRYWGIFRLSWMHNEIQANLRKLPYCRM